MKVTSQTKSGMEFAAIEATNNRLAVRELRRTLLIAMRWIKTADSSSEVGDSMVEYIKTKLAMTVPSKLRGLK
jgi:hypothetical protein